MNRPLCPSLSPRRDSLGNLARWNVLRRLAPSVALVAGSCLLSSTASAASDLRVVDPEGRSVAGLSIEFVDQPAGAFGESDLPLIMTGDDDGLIPLDDLVRAPLDLRVASRGNADGQSHAWAVRYVHGNRRVDETAPADLSGAKPRVYDTSQDIVCVVEPTGTIRIEVVGAREDDRYHATFMDRRPEPGSHRDVIAGGSFQGSKGTLQVPGGRGLLYLAQEGHLGSPVLMRDGPLMVSVAAGGTSLVSVRFLEGPTTRLIAPFDSIPFRKIEAIAPDGETVVARYSFDASPLRLSSRIAVVAGGERPLTELPSLRLPKQLLRAVDVPLALPAIELPGETEGAPRFIDRAPMELIFPIDPGIKMRLPEVEAGWINEALAGLTLLAGNGHGSQTAVGVTCPAPGRIRVSGAGSGAEWEASVTVRGPDGAVRPFTEALVSAPGSLLARGITGPDGVLTVEGIRADSISVALVDSVADHAVVQRPTPQPDAETPPRAEGTITVGGRVRLTGTWQRSPKNTSVGDLIVLVPASEEAIKESRRFMTRAAPLTFLDASGAFDFGVVPRGVYTLRAGRDSEAAIDLRQPERGKPAGGAPTTTPWSRGLLKLSGTGASFQATLSVQ